MPDLVQLLETRGFIAQITDSRLQDHFNAAPRWIYAGFDPSAASLHVGHMVPVMALAHAQRCGHHPIIVVGGGTGLIGDPSGKSAERRLMEKEEVASNCERIREQLSHFLDFSGPARAVLVNNADWLTSLGLVDFLRDIGKFFSVNSMIARESVRRRLEERDQGISFTEFSYALLQAYDFFYLSETYGCTVQIGGNDQWGNIVAGIDLIGRMRSRQAYGITVPLLLTSSGTKFGKTESGAVWLDPSLTSPYRMHQFWLNTSDEDTVRFLKLFTFLYSEEIDELGADIRSNPEIRRAQRVLAAQFTQLVHGQDVLGSVEKISRILFGATDVTLDPSSLDHLAREIPCSEIDPLQYGAPLPELLAKLGIAKSKTVGRQLIESGGFYVNNVRRTEIGAKLTSADLGGLGAVLLRTGKKSHHLVRVRN